MEINELIRIGKEAIAYSRITPRLKTGDCICVLESTDNRLYTGYSMSFSNSCFCAEQSAIIQMINDGVYSIKRMVTISKEGQVIPPCGKCIEIISHLPNSTEIEIAISDFAVKFFRDIYPFDWKEVVKK